MTEKTAAAKPEAAREEKPRLTKLWESLKDRLAKENERKAYFERLTTDKPFQKFMAELDEEIEAEVLKLEDTEKKAFDFNVASIKAKRWMLTRLRNLTSGAKVEEARRELETFEKANALFISAIKEGKDPEAAEAKSDASEEYVFDAYDRILHPLVDSNDVDDVVCDQGTDDQLLHAISDTLPSDGGEVSPGVKLDWSNGNYDPVISLKPEGKKRLVLRGKALCERVRRYFVPGTPMEGDGAKEAAEPVPAEEPAPAEVKKRGRKARANVVEAPSAAA